MPSEVTICAADLDDRLHYEGILRLLNMYASEPVAGGEPIADEVQARLIPELKQQANGRYFLAIESEAVVGVAICFVGFSTFRAKPVINIHDLAVHRDRRGQGIGELLLQAVEVEAKGLGCCGITLEVKEDNRARRLYERFGFAGGNPDGTVSLFMAKRFG
ncbi:MAG: GNAT family N-acetyltransferase [Planctomycetaceae bacterium]|nr:GNAT family N-acetyltransferase [Planctomycetaceae bacterium]